PNAEYGEEWTLLLDTATGAPIASAPAPGAPRLRSGMERVLEARSLLVLGWATVRAHYLKSYPSQAAMGRLSFTGVQVEMLGDDAAYVVGHFALQRALDNPVSRPHGVFTLLFRKFPEGWKIVSDHTTAAAKMPAAVPVKAH